jgi:Uma2 family endonuclease
MTEPGYDLLPMTVDEYLAFEDASDVKHEYVDGYAYAMSGVHSRHARIVANVSSLLWSAARGGPCRVYSSDLRQRASATRYYYPDVMSVCVPRADDGRILENPCVVIEVTSPSTRRTDHSEKLDAYRRIPTLRSYLIVELSRREIHRWWREAGEDWRYELLVEVGAVAFPCPAVSLTLDEIYERVTFPPHRPRRVREPEPAYEE